MSSRNVFFKLKQNLRNNELASSFGIVFIATSSANVISYFYNLIAGRMLGPESFGVFTSMLSLLVIFSVVATTFQIVVTRYVAILNLHKRNKAIMKYFLKSLKIFSCVGFACFVLIAVASPFLRNFLRVESVNPILAVSIIIALSMISPSAVGVLQGIQDFKAYSAITILNPLLRLIFGVLLMLLGFGVTGAIGSSAISGVFVFILSLFFIRKLRINDEVVNYDDIGIKSVFGFSGYVLASIFLLTAIMNLDMVFVKHFFSPHDAGIYGSVVTIGKIILYLPGAMSIVLLPKTSEIGKINHDSSKILYRSILITFFICMFVSAIYFLVPNFVVNLMFGEKFLPAVPYIKYYGLAMVFLSILQLCSTYFISVYSKFVLPVVLSVTLLLEIIFFNIFTRNLYHYIFAILSVSFTASLVLLIIVLIKTMKLNHVR